MTVSEKTFEQLVLEDPEGFWELYCGELRSKSAIMTTPHNTLQDALGRLLWQQLPEDRYEVRVNGRTGRPDANTSFLPDVMVIPIELWRRHRDATLERYPEPLPLIVEVWSPSTGDYDVDEKLPEYQRRGDEEIWRVHPYERTLIAWRRQADGSYTEALYRGGEVRPASLEGVAIRLEELFAVLDR